MKVLERLRRVLPQGWHPDTDPVLDTILRGMAGVWNVLLDQVAYTRAQARLLTATGDWLDGKAVDFLGAGFFRRANEPDGDFAARTAREVLRRRATRPSIEQVLTDNGAVPFRVFEAFRPADAGGYNIANGYTVAGGYGSLLMPYQVLVDLKRPVGAGIINNGGYGLGLGYNVGGGSYRAASDIKGGITDAGLYSAITSVLPAGVTAWTRIS